MARAKQDKLVLKQGKLSRDELGKIERLCETKTDEEIASILRRPLVTIQRYRLAYVSENPNIVLQHGQNKEIRDSLHDHYQWEEIKKGFTSDEIIIFENSYVELVSQFKHDIMATEQKQIFQAITLEIFMSRYNRERMQVQRDIDRLARMIDELDTDNPTKEEQRQIQEMTQIINGLRASTQSKTKEYKDLSDKYSSIIKELKGTRDQRLERVENSKQSYTGLLRMLEEEELRGRVGAEMEIMKAAVEKETVRLSQYHTYMDGSVSQPLMTPTTIHMTEPVTKLGHLLNQGKKLMLKDVENAPV